jgi:glutathione synthase/RimK-type ligase-like ATP-grasp enzyme
MSTSIAERLNRSCYCVGVDVPALLEWLDRHLASRGLDTPIAATHPHLFTGAPVFVAREHVAAMGTVIRAAESVIALPRFRNAVLEQAPPIARSEPRTRGGLLSFDFHLGDTGPKLIEINTNAGGAVLNAVLARAQQACCEEVRRLFDEPSAQGLEDALIDVFVEEWRLARGDAPLTCVAIVDDAPGEQYLYPEFLLIQRAFEARGIAASICDPGALRSAGGSVWDGERRVDLICNRLTDFYLEEPAHRVIRDSVASDAAVVTPHPHAHAIYANKRNLALLSDRSALQALGVDDATVAALLESVPRTLPISSRDAADWWAERKHWFFKPAAGYGSRGSYRGDKITRKAFGEVLQGDYVAQALIPPSERSSNDGSGPRSLKLDLRCYVYGGRILLTAARLYQGQTTNFRTPGGGFAPVYVTADSCFVPSS